MVFGGASGRCVVPLKDATDPYLVLTVSHDQAVLDSEHSADVADCAI